MFSTGRIQQLRRNAADAFDARLRCRIRLALTLQRIHGVLCLVIVPPHYSPVTRITLRLRAAVWLVTKSCIVMHRGRFSSVHPNARRQLAVGGAAPAVIGRAGRFRYRVKGGTATGFSDQLISTAAPHRAFSWPARFRRGRPSDCAQNIHLATHRDCVPQVFELNGGFGVSERPDGGASIHRPVVLDDENPRGTSTTICFVDG